MQSNQNNQKLLLVFLRHGERIDEVKKENRHEKDKDLQFPICDPMLTVNGKKMAAEAG